MGKNFKLEKWTLVAGCDCAYSMDGKIQVCAAVLMEFPSLKIIKKNFSINKNPKPYIPGKFYLREGDISIETIKNLNEKIDLLFVNGLGKGNIYGVGLATYIGENLKIPTVGITKELLGGKIYHFNSFFSPVFYGKKIIAYAFKKEKNKKPVFLSEGYGIDILSLKGIIDLFCIYKIPEPLRQAHIFAKNYLKNLNF